MKLIALLAFCAGTGLTVFLIVHAGLTPVASALASLGVTGLLVIALVHLPVVAMLGAAWWAVGRGQGRRALSRFIWARAIRDAAAEALPFSQVGGYVIGARALSLTGTDAASSAVSTLLDLVLELLPKLPYVLLGLILLEAAKPSSGTAVAIVAFLVVLIVAAAVLRPNAKRFGMGWIERFLARWPRLAESRERIAAAFAQMTARRSAIAASLTLHFVCWIAGAAETWLIFRLMGTSVSLPAALVIDSLLGALRMISFFVPAAIGVQEGGYVLLCGLFGFPPGAALAFSFARRARDILIAAPVLLSWQAIEGQALLPSRSKS
ncbi:MAG: flippase-like domain-containing protein [Alphaproteobacteria bacterium]|nr:flippase-like domain-containing protein [Alphaproteobacteria bacterium]